MARKDANDTTLSRQVNRMEDMNRELVQMLRSEASPLTGDDVGRSDELLNIHHRYNNIIQQDYQSMRAAKDSTDSTYDYIVNALLGGRRDYSATQRQLQNTGYTSGNATQDKLLKNMQLDKLFTMGDTQVASYFLSTSSDIIHIYDEIDSVCSYFYQLEEANMITRDNVLRAEQVNEDISMNIEFPGVTDDVSSYVSIVKKALGYQNIGVKIRDHVATKAIKYGTYYIMLIPYSEIGPKLMTLNQNNSLGYGGYAFYESTDTRAIFGDEDSADLGTCMESVTNLLESMTPEENRGKNGELPEDMQKMIENIKNNAKNLYICEDDSVPDTDGIGTHKKLNASIQKGIIAALKKAEKSLDSNDPTLSSDIRMSFHVVGDPEITGQGGIGWFGNDLEDYLNRDTTTKMTDLSDFTKKVKPDVGSLANNDVLNQMAEKAAKKTEKENGSTQPTVLGQDGITPDQLKQSEQMIGCHVKLVDPRQLRPIKIFDFVIGYYYFENYDYAKMGTSVSDIMSNQMNYNQRSMIIDGIVDSVLKNLEYGDILKGDNQLRMQKKEITL
jgi:hypothetical protein